MNKKFLSAILFGALMITSTGTFVSCKDYDDDIENLQTQIDANAKSIADLKASLDGANYVTSVTVSGNNLVVTTKNGGSTTIALPEHEDEVGSMVSVNADGYLVIDGEVTDIKACEATEEGEFLAPVKIEGGEWMVLQEDGTYAPLGLKASSVAVTGNETDGYVLTVTDGEGNETVVKLPTAASSIVSIAFDNTVQTAGDTINIAKATWNKTPGNFNWQGKALPANGDAIYTSADQVEVRIDPVSVDATTVPFYLTTSKNSTMQYITLAAAEDKTELTGTPTGRAAYGNGLYKLSFGPQLVVKADTAKYAKDIKDHATKLHALNANNSFRSIYALQVVRDDAKAPVLETLKVNSGNALTIGGSSLEATVKVGAENTVTFQNAAALYDAYFTVEDKYKEAFGVTWDNATRKFTVGKNPDSSTTVTEFPLNVVSADINGEINITTITIKLASQISSIKLYADATHEIKKDASANKFNIQLADMHTALGSNLNTWKLNVKSAKFGLYEKYEDGDVNTEITASPLSPTYKNANNVEVAELDKASYINVAVDNSKGQTLDTKYYIKVSFYNHATTQDATTYLNAIIVPVTFTAPSVSELISAKAGYVVDGTVNAYLYQTNSTEVEINKYFTIDATLTAASNKATVELDPYTTVVSYNNTNYKSSNLAELSSTKDVDVVTLKLADAASVKTNGAATELGYGQKLTASVVKNNYEGWSYKAYSGDNAFAFTIRIMSPIYEGTVKPATGSTITVSANDFQNGAKITDAMIKGYDYNNNAYNVVADMVDGTNVAWANPQISTITAAKDKDNYLAVAPEFTAATTDADGKTVNGVIIVKGEAISNDVTIAMPVSVTDVWGYTKKQDVSVTIKKN